MTFNTIQATINRLSHFLDKQVRPALTPIAIMGHEIYKWSLTGVKGADTAKKKLEILILKAKLAEIDKQLKNYYKK